MSLSRRLLIPLALLGLTADAAVRLTYPMGGAPTAIYWPRESFPIEYKVDARVANAFSGASAMVDRSFSAWSGITAADITFRSGGVVAGAKAGFDRQNTITLVDDLYRGQNYIAVTTNWYDERGRMTEADIQIDASLATSAYNIQQTLQHEIGHLLGLDHSGVLTSTMYPYVGRGGSTLLDSDDTIAIATLYPKGDPMLGGGTLSGRVTGDQGGIFAAQVVAVNEKGEPVATGLTSESGEFELHVPAGAYRLYTEPLDGPVDPKNLAGIWRQARVVAFGTQFLEGSPLRVENGKVYGNLILSARTPTGLNPRWIGSSPEDRSDFSLGVTPVSLKPGQTVSLAVAGDGFTSGMTTFEVLKPGIRRTSDYRYAANYVSATFAVAPDVAPGSAVILVKSGNDTATLTGALRIEGSQRLRAAR